MKIHTGCTIYTVRCTPCTEKAQEKKKKRESYMNTQYRIQSARASERKTESPSIPLHNITVPTHTISKVQSTQTTEQRRAKVNGNGTFIRNRKRRREREREHKTTFKI